LRLLQAGEAESAFRAALRTMRARRMRAADLLGDAQELGVAREALATLVSENTALRGELERRDAQSTALVPTWQAVGAAITDTKRTADWLLGLRGQGLAWLSDWEVGFMTDIATRWSGPLTSKQRPVFQRIVDRVCTRTGLQPPT
jgi:hypothetical protein